MKEWRCCRKGGWEVDKASRKEEGRSQERQGAEINVKESE
jgi:hypothetical protein